MAEDKEKKDEGEEQAKKKGLPAIVLVAVGAAIGGAGVVFLMPTEAKETQKHEVHVVPKKKFKHPLDEGIQHNFNLGKGRGSKIAKVHFTFIYEAEVHVPKDGHEAASGHDHKDVPNEDALKSLRANWDTMMSRVLIVLKSAEMDDLNGNIRSLEMRIKNEINRALFPGGEAVVVELVWGKILVQ